LNNGGVKRNNGGVENNWRCKVEVRNKIWTGLNNVEEWLIVDWALGVTIEYRCTIRNNKQENYRCILIILLKIVKVKKESYIINYISKIYLIE